MSTPTNRRMAGKQNYRNRRDSARKKAALHKRFGRRRKNENKVAAILWTVILILFLWVLVGAALHLGSFFLDRWSVRKVDVPDWVDVQLIDIDGAARRGERLEGIHDIVIHYVGNPGTTAQENRDFFNQPDTDVSSHFLVGLEGEVIQCVPLDEKSSASNERNRDTISIEVCHPGADGAFTDASYRSLVKLTAWLCGQYDLDRDHIIRHYDVTGKACPLYYVEHPDAWEQFLADVDKNL